MIFKSIITSLFLLLGCACVPDAKGSNKKQEPPVPYSLEIMTGWPEETIWRLYDKEFNNICYITMSSTRIFCLHNQLSN